MSISSATIQTAFCSSCGCEHSLPRAPAMDAAQQLMASLSSELETEYLYGKALGKMFGVLVCRTAEGKITTLKAFSGQYDGRWEIDGWVPPLFDVQGFATLNTPVEKEIKALGRQAEATALTPEKRQPLLHKRKKLSQQLMKDIHKLYRLNNFRKEQCSLYDLFPEGSGIPTGTGDCCAPKLLNFAAIHGLRPIALAEFFWGKTNRSASRHQGYFYPACKNKCGPILGFLLCGLQELKHQKKNFLE